MRSSFRTIKVPIFVVLVGATFVARAIGNNCVVSGAS
jgi:hypothetical protein